MHERSLWHLVAATCVCSYQAATTLATKRSQAALPFDPDPRTQNRFASQVLRVRIGQRDDVSPHAAQVQLADGRPWRARVTNEIINLLFEDGQTPTRRAVRDLYYATSGNPSVDPAFQQVVNRAADAMGASEDAFFAAVQAVVTAAP